jgi:hypothetical protein
LRRGVFLVRGFPDLARGIEVHGGDSQADDDVRPDGRPRHGDEARRDDGDIGKDVIARRQEGGARQAAAGGASPARWMKCYRRT